MTIFTLEDNLCIFFVMALINKVSLADFTLI